MKTYDILNAGPRNRFMANGRIVSNSGRAIQLQNLVRNDLTTLNEARALIKMGCFDMVASIYGDVPEILSQLIRTMLIPKPGCEFIVADFSAIEARVLEAVFIRKNVSIIGIYEIFSRYIPIFRVIFHNPY